MSDSEQPETKASETPPAVTSSETKASETKPAETSATETKPPETSSAEPSSPAAIATRSETGSGSVLRFDGVSAFLADERFANVRDIRFELSQGELILIALEDHRDSPLPGLAIGERTDAPAGKSGGADAADDFSRIGMDGTVAFEGVPWSDRSAHEGLACRGRIGWVLTQPAWVNNLSVLENVLLKSLHHTRVRRSKLLAEAQELAYAVGLGEIPARRMSSLSRSELRRAEWVRAFLGRPTLVMLQRPLGGIEREHWGALVELVRRFLASGTAVLWLSDDGAEQRLVGELATRRYAMYGAHMNPVGG